MNEQQSTQPQLDFITGRSSYINRGVASIAERKACAELNRQRASAIKESAREYAPSESIPRDVWAASFARRSKLLEVPLISLNGMGLSDDDVEAMCSVKLGNVGFGREATAWEDEREGVVYKLFDLKMDDNHKGTIGYKIVMQGMPPDEVEIVQVPASIDDILDKICILHEAGACPTEIAGLTDDGKYLVVKQPKCSPLGDFRTDQRAAVEAMNAISPKGSYRGNELWIFYACEKNWILSDLHPKNIMRLSNGAPTIIDALTGPLPDYYITLHPKLSEAAVRAKASSQGNKVAPDNWYQNITDDEL